MQITARSERDLSPEGIIQKVSDASGSKYSGGGASISSTTTGPLPVMASKPAFNPSRFRVAGVGYNPLAGRSRVSTADSNVDEDGWGKDAPQVTRTQLEKVSPAYNPTKVNMAELTKQTQEPSRLQSAQKDRTDEHSDVIKGGYQPVGKVDIAALRARSERDSTHDDRPSTVKGAYEPVGKVDIAAIRAKAAPRPSDETSSTAAMFATTPSGNDRPVPFGQSERLTSLPKPKVANKFGSTTNSFTGTRAPLPGSSEARSSPKATPVGTASKTFADQGGKTPAQIWAEKKARERALSGAGERAPSSPSGASSTAPIIGQSSGGEWKSGYGGKSWAPVSTTATGRSATGSVEAQQTGEPDGVPEERASSPAGGVGALRDRFKGSAPSMSTANKPTAGVVMPGLPSKAHSQQNVKEDDDDDNERAAITLPTPPVQSQSPTPPTPPAMRSASPIRVAMPVGRGAQSHMAAPELEPARPLPTASLVAVVPDEDDLTDEPASRDPARVAAEATAAATFGNATGEVSGSGNKGKRAIIQYDYERAEENELELREGEEVTDIDMVDEDWWMGRNSRGETGLFPSNYVELVEDDEEEVGPHEITATPTLAATRESESSGQSAAKIAAGPVAIAQYDYEAAEDNELSFAEGSKITGLVSPIRLAYPFEEPLEALSHSAPTYVSLPTLTISQAIPGRGLVVRSSRREGRSVPGQLRGVAGIVT